MSYYPPYKSSSNNIKVELDLSNYATKNDLNACLNAYLQTSTFNSKVTAVESKIKAADIIAKSANTKANIIRSDLSAYAKKADVATDINSNNNNNNNNNQFISAP